MFALFIESGYEIIEDSSCYPYVEQVNSLSRAKSQCSDNPTCIMFYRKPIAETHYLCHTPNAEIKPAEIKPSVYSNSVPVVYIKSSEYICNCTSFWRASNRKMATRLIIIYN